MYQYLENENLNDSHVNVNILTYFYGNHIKNCVSSLLMHFSLWYGSSAIDCEI